MHVCMEKNVARLSSWKLRVEERLAKFFILHHDVLKEVAKQVPAHVMLTTVRSSDRTCEKLKRVLGACVMRKNTGARGTKYCSTGAERNLFY